MESLEGEAKGHGVVGGLDLTGGPETPRLEGPPRGDNTCRVPSKGNSFMFGDRQGQ